MNVSSLDLSQELHKLSGWSGDLQCKTHESQFDGHGWCTIGNHTVSYVGYGELQPDDDVYNAYSLGYLLRKLPPVYEEPSGVKWVLKLEVSDGSWDCYYNANIQQDTFAGTPEDAACRLAIELWKQGVLKS